MKVSVCVVTKSTLSCTQLRRAYPQYTRTHRGNSRERVTATVFRDVADAVSDVLGAENVGHGKYRSAFTTLALEVLVYVIVGKRYSQEVELLTRLRNVFEDRDSLVENLRRLADLLSEQP